jgi:hypothetical protein
MGGPSPPPPPAAAGARVRAGQIHWTHARAASSAAETHPEFTFCSAPVLRAGRISSCPFVSTPRIINRHVQKAGFQLMPIPNKQPMNQLDTDFDIEMHRLESEWRQGYEASIEARAAYQALAASRNAKAELLDAARERLDRAEAAKSRIMTKIERLEDHLLRRG